MLAEALLSLPMGRLAIDEQVEALDDARDGPLTIRVAACRPQLVVRLEQTHPELIVLLAVEIEGLLALLRIIHTAVSQQLSTAVPSRFPSRRGRGAWAFKTILTSDHINRSLCASDPDGDSQSVLLIMIPPIVK
ncbi:MAG: hypothetical protein GVY22_12285 [Gammaproteobacteria bacterium]|nr:hypothetical protein [Gammaproteobacteria bacterium]